MKNMEKTLMNVMIKCSWALALVFAAAGIAAILFGGPEWKSAGRSASTAAAMLTCLGLQARRCMANQ